MSADPTPLRRPLAALVLVLLAALVAPAAATAQDPPPKGPKILLVFDASRSMSSDSGDGTPKLQAAKDAAIGLVDDLPDTTQVGLRLFGGTLPSRPISRACRDSSLTLPIGPSNRADAKEKIQSFKAQGRTPIAFALQEAAKDLGDEGPRSIILVSDGKDTCPPPRPCDVAEEIARGGVELRIQAIGFNVDRAAREQLECIAKAGGGVYRDAEDAETLREELRILSTRALREYVVRGTPVKGGPNLRGATPVAPGRYVDKVPPDSERWYAIDLKRGETLKGSVSIIPPTREIADVSTLVESELEVVTPAGDIPDIQNSSAAGEPFERRGFVGGIGVVSRPIGVGEQAEPEQPFSEPGRYYLKFTFRDSDDKALFDATAGRPYDVEMAVEVLGRKGGSTPAPKADGDPAEVVGAAREPAGPAEPPPTALLAGVGGGVTLLGFAGGLAALRRRRPS